MKIYFSISLFLSFSICPLDVLAQWADVPLEETNSANENANPTIDRVVSQQVSMPKLLLLGTLRFYQIALSQHDGNSCPFYPSCSRYAVAAIKSYGIFQGLCMASDRLQRCNGCIVGKYIYSEKFNCFLDPPSDHDIFDNEIPAANRIP